MSRGLQDQHQHALHAASSRNGQADHAAADDYDVEINVAHLA
jgi:hypothetical protein